MKKIFLVLFCVTIIALVSLTCSKHAATIIPHPPVDSGLINSRHLDDLYTPVIFQNGAHTAGIFIYSNYPDYHPVDATGEGFTCVDDVSRAALFYLRSEHFSTDTAIQAKAFNLIRFILEMQADNGYFYNFLFNNGLINKGGATSVANPNWWSWRALQTLTEAGPLIKNKDVQLSGRIDLAVQKLISNIKTDLVNLPLTTTIINGITIPQWLPLGSATDQAATLILSLIPYCMNTNDIIISDYIRKLADGIAMMQQGDATHYPYSFFLSFENQWHAYGSDQAYALLLAGEFLQDTSYTRKGLNEVDNFYPWLFVNGFKSAISLNNNNDILEPLTEKTYDQIAYGFRPMVFAAIEAYNLTGQGKYADIAGHAAAWFLGNNIAGTNMYSSSTGICYDAISTGNNVNLNSGAESTIEALLALQRVENYPAVKTALNKYKKL